MKKAIRYSCITLLLFACIKSNAQPSFIHTTGRYISGPCGDTLMLKGINYAVYNWGYTLSDEQIAEVAKTGANVIRFAWYSGSAAGGGAPVYATSAALDSAISKCVQHKMIAIIELHDNTCSNDTAALIALAEWYSAPDIQAILKKYKESVIINIANEALGVTWKPTPTTPAQYLNTYKTIISKLRANPDFNYPLMIDATGCGSNPTIFTTDHIGTALISHDPLHNIIFSNHAYWHYNAPDSAAQLSVINMLLAENLPFVFGEVANLQDDAVDCEFNLSYQSLLAICEAKRIGWMAWLWDHDNCSSRQMSSDGTFAKLTPYGKDIVSNTTYGLNSRLAGKSHFLTEGSCPDLSVSLINNTRVSVDINCYPNPTEAQLFIDITTLVPENFRIEMYNLMGRLLTETTISSNNHNNRLNLQQYPTGTYILRISNTGGFFSYRHFLKK